MAMEAFGEWHGSEEAPEGSPAPLWPLSSSHATSWNALLPHLGTSFLRDKHPSHSSNDTVHNYTLKLQGANPLLTHVLACQLSSYALLRSFKPEVTKAWHAFLSTGSLDTTKAKTSQSSIPTDSSSDSDGGEWSQSRNAKRRLKQRQERNAKARPHRAAEFQHKHLSAQDVARALQL